MKKQCLPQDRWDLSAEKSQVYREGRTNYKGTCAYSSEEPLTTSQIQSMFALNRQQFLET